MKKNFPHRKDKSDRNNGKNGKHKGKFKGTCFHCGKVAHRKENCWELEENRSKRPEWCRNNAIEAGAATVECLCATIDENSYQDFKNACTQKEDDSEKSASCDSIKVIDSYR